MDPSNRITLTEVAAAAEVSMATASKVLNGRSGVSQTTRERVLDVISGLGYEPIVETRRNNEARTVGVVLNSLRSQYASELLQGIVGAAKDWDTAIAVNTSDHTHQDEDHSKELESWIQTAAERNYSALILASIPLSSSQILLCERHRLPLVMVDPIGALPRKIPSISSTNWAGGLEATEHLIELGHTRIAHAGGPTTSVPAAERLLGFRSALDRNQIEINESLILSEGFTYEAGLSMGRRLLTSDPRPTAIVASSDPSAMGIYEASRELGIQVPGNLSVVGFDDSRGAAWASPPLTTIRQPLEQMGRFALRTALELSTTESMGSAPIQLATSIVVRSSTSAPKG